MGKTAALGLKMLWTMGCPPTKVNTQTTHSCPSPKTSQHTHKHAYRYTLCPMLPVPHLSSGIFFPRQSFRFFSKWIPQTFFFSFKKEKWEITFFLLLIFPIIFLHPHLPPFSKHTLLIHSCSLHTDRLTHKIQRTRLRLNLNPFRKHVVCASCI